MTLGTSKLLRPFWSRCISLKTSESLAKHFCRKNVKPVCISSSLRCFGFEWTFCCFSLLVFFLLFFSDGDLFNLFLCYRKLGL